MNRRRILIAGAVGMALPSAFAQTPTRKLRITVLHSVPLVGNHYHEALKQRLASHGFVEGRNLTIDTPVPQVAYAVLRRQLAAQFSQRPDAILSFTARVTEAALAETDAVPVVFAWIADPVSSGIATSFSRPGGNATGVSNRFAEVAAKRLELLRELAPEAKRVAVIGPIYEPETEAAAAALRRVSQRLGFELIEVSTDLRVQALEVQRVIRKGAEALLPLNIFSAFGARRTGEELVELCLRHRLPAVYAESELVEAGGLLSYGTNLLEDARRAADMLVKVLRGAKPAEMPVDQASNFELAINLKTARAIGITVPPSLTYRADRVIE